MKSAFDKALKESITLDDVEKSVLKLLKETRNNSDKLGFVSGTVFSDGPELVKTNINKLSDHTNNLKQMHSFPIFSAVDILYRGLFEKLPESKLEYQKRRKRFFLFWKRILESGHITDIFMTPRWQKSEGATDEHKTAKKTGIHVYYMNDDGSTYEIVETVAYIHVKDKKLLLALSKGKEAFYMPGGKPETKEDQLQALLREIKEELQVNLIPKTIKHYGIFEAQAYGKNIGTKVRIDCYVGQHTGHLHPGAEISKLKFFTHLEYFNMPDTAPAVKLIFDDLKAKNIIK